MSRNLVLNLSIAYLYFGNLIRSHRNTWLTLHNKYCQNEAFSPTIFFEQINFELNLKVDFMLNMTKKSQMTLAVILVDMFRSFENYHNCIDFFQIKKKTNKGEK